MVIKRVSSLLSKLREPSVWNELGNKTNNPCKETQYNCNNPVISVDTIGGHFESSASNVHDKNLSSDDDDENNQVEGIVEEIFENV